MSDKQKPSHNCESHDTGDDFLGVRSSDIDHCTDNQEEQRQRVGIPFKAIDCCGNDGRQSHSESPFPKTPDSTLSAFLDIFRSRLVAFALGVALGGVITIQAVTEAFAALDTSSISLCTTAPAAPAN